VRFGTMGGPCGWASARCWPGFGFFFWGPGGPGWSERERGCESSRITSATWSRRRPTWPTSSAGSARTSAKPPLNGCKQGGPSGCAASPPASGSERGPRRGQVPWYGRVRRPVPPHRPGRPTGAKIAELLGNPRQPDPAYPWPAAQRSFTRAIPTCPCCRRRRPAWAAACRCAEVLGTPPCAR
jgi:hypothetical protein